MSDSIRYQIHIKRLHQIKQRDNHYPSYNIKTKGYQSPSPKRMKINKLLSEIKANKISISTIKKDLAKKKPVNFEEDDKYIYDREVENIQKKLYNKLIYNNNNLKSQVKVLQNNNNMNYKYPKKKNEKVK